MHGAGAKSRLTMIVARGAAPLQFGGSRVERHGPEPTLMKERMVGRLAVIRCSATMPNGCRSRTRFRQWAAFHRPATLGRILTDILNEVLLRLATPVLQ